MALKFPVLVFVFCLIFAVPAFASCVAHWSLNNSGGLDDACTGDWDAINTNAVSGSVGVFNEAYNFVYTPAAYLTIGDLDLSGSFTVCSWVKLDSIAVSQVLAGKSDGSDATTNFILFYHSGDGVFKFASNFTVIAGTTIPSTGNWYHVCGFTNSTGGLMGIIVNNSFEGNASWAAAAQNNIDLFLGKISGLWVLDGLLDDVWILNHTATCGANTGGSCVAGSEINNLFTYGNLTGIPVPVVGCSIVLNSPADASYQTNATPTFAYTPTCDGVPSSCYLTVNNTRRGDNATAIANDSLNYITSNASLSNGLQYWNITCESNTSSTRSFNLWSTNNMSITDVLVNGLPNATLNPTESGNTIVTVSFNVTDDSGAGNILLAASWANETNDSITNTSCAWSGYASGNTKGIACQLAMPYYISGGFKQLQVYAMDAYNWSANSSSANITYNTIYVVSLNSSSISSGQIVPGSSNNVFAQAQKITNSGNGALNISIQGASLTNGPLSWDIGNFSVNTVPIPIGELVLSTASQYYATLAVNATLDSWFLVDAVVSIPSLSYTGSWQWVSSA